MKQNIKTIITTTGGILGISLSIFSLTFIVLAWTGPLNNPPICPAGEVGCDEPLHSGVAAQAKTGGLLLNTGGAEYGLIVEQGNVGIGTTAPGAKLEVAGDIYGWNIPKSVKTTTTTHNGNFGGYVALYNWIQTNGCSGYHVCSSEEITAALQVGKEPNSFCSFVSASPHSYGSQYATNINDCRGFYSSAIADARPCYNNTEHRPTHCTCDVLKTVCCCK